MRENLAKRLSFFGRLLVIVWLISLVSWLQRIESYDLRQDVIDLDLIQTLVDLSSIYASPNKISPKVFQNAEEWLDQKHPEISRRKGEVRIQVAEWLIEQVGPEETARAKEERGDRATFIFVDFIGDSLDTPTLTSGRRAEYSTVSQILDRLDALAVPTQISVVQELKSVPLPTLEGDRAKRIRSVRLSGSNIRCVFVGGSDQEFQQRAGVKVSLGLPVDTVTLFGPAMLELSDPSRPENDGLENLFRADERKKLLRATYGHLPIKEARQIAADGLTQAYQRIEVLGFSFSTRKFPFAVLFLCAFAVVGSFLTVRKAAEGSLKIFAEDQSEGAVSMITGSPWTRVLLWLALPLCAMATSLPLIPLTSVEKGILWSGTAALFLFGIQTFFSSRRL